MSENQSAKQYVVCDNEVFQLEKHKLYTTYNKVNVPHVETCVPEWHGPKLPLSIWHDIMGFCKYSYDKIQSETLIYLFYDEDKEQPWSFWVPPQTTAGMTVKSNPDHPDYATQRAKYPDTMFGTVHHHCATSAFQSGTDEADETQREGLHFTIGKLDQDNDFDVHFRMTIANCHSEIDSRTYIEVPQNPFKKNCGLDKKLQKQVIQELHKVNVTTLPQSYLDKDYSKFMENVENIKTTYQPKLGSSYYTPELAHFPDMNPIKKNKDEESIHSIIDLVDEFITLIFFDYQYEEILINYYTNLGDQSSIQSVTHGTLQPEAAARTLSSVYTDFAYLQTAEGLEAKHLLKNFLFEQKSQGLDFTSKDLIHGFSTYEERTGI